MLFDANSRMKWLAACGEFDAAIKKVTKKLKNSHEHHWKAHQNLATYLSSKAFRRYLTDNIAHAFRVCPNLVNIVIAHSEYGPQHVMSRKIAMFHSMHPHSDVWIESSSHDPSEFGLLELPSAVHSLTIIDIPFKCIDYSKVASLKSFESLKHIRVTYRFLFDNPTTKFGFNLEEAIRKASILETLWVDMPSLPSNIFDGDAMLVAVKSDAFRDILLHNITVSEDLLVDFLLRHSQSLQQLSIGVTLKTGTWISTFHRISLQMTALHTLQIAYLRERKGSDIVQLHSHWWLKARNFVTEGGKLQEPPPSDEERDTSKFHVRNVEDPLRHRELPEKGLWEEYDASVRGVFKTDLMERKSQR